MHEVGCVASDFLEAASPTFARRISFYQGETHVPDSRSRVIFSSKRSLSAWAVLIPAILSLV